MTSLFIDPARRHQTIDGFGVHGAFRQATNIRRFPAKDRDRILDLLFGVGDGSMGASIVRSCMGDSGDWGTPIDGPAPSVEPAPGVYETAAGDDQIWFMREAKKRGCLRFVSTAWSPPAWMKSNTSVIGGGFLRPDRYGHFAEYLARYIETYRDVHGLPMYAISPWNEPEFPPDYSSCLWTDAEAADFFEHHLGPVLRAHGLDTKTFGPETNDFGNAALERYSELITRSEAAGNLDIVAMHGYDNDVVSALDPSLVAGRPIWMSELCDIGLTRAAPFSAAIEDGLLVATRIHEYLTVASCSAFLYFWAASYQNKANASLIALDVDKLTYEVCKRAFTFGNFSRFVRPGFDRVEASWSSTGPTKGSAFRGPQGELVVVLINPESAVRTIQLNLHGNPGVKFAAYVTDSQRDLEFTDTIPDWSAGAFVLPPLSVVSLVGQITSPQAR